MPLVDVAPAAVETALAQGVVGLALLRRGVDLDVWDAWDVERECSCVAKTLRPDRVADDAARRALLQEGRLLAGLAHPNLVRIYAVVEQPRPLLVLETVGGATLEHLLERHRRLAVPDLAELGLQLGSALGFLHRHGWLHLDLKPSNVVCDNGRAVLIDLSIARRPGRGRRGAGTRQYMAPEQARGGRVDVFSDVWGLGSVLYEAAAGERAYPDGVAGSACEFIDQ